MKKDYKIIEKLLHKEADYFENILSDYKSCIKADYRSDGKWFEELLIRRKRHIDQLNLIFNNEKARTTIKEKIPENLKKRFKTTIASILSLDAKMLERLGDIKDEQTNMLGKFNNFHKFIQQNAENVNKAKVVDLSIK